MKIVVSNLSNVYQNRQNTFSPTLFSEAITSEQRIRLNCPGWFNGVMGRSDGDLARVGHEKVRYANLHKRWTNYNNIKNDTNQVEIIEDLMKSADAIQTAIASAIQSLLDFREKDPCRKFITKDQHAAITKRIVELQDAGRNLISKNELKLALQLAQNDAWWENPSLPAVLKSIPGISILMQMLKNPAVRNGLRYAR